MHIKQNGMALSERIPRKKKYWSYTVPEQYAIRYRDIFYKILRLNVAYNRTFWVALISSIIYLQQVVIWNWKYFFLIVIRIMFKI